MDDDYLEWKPDRVKLESELILDDDVKTDADFKTPYPEISQNASNETSIEQSSSIPERYELHLVYGMPSIPEPATTTCENAANGMVKIKEEMSEDPISTSEHAMVLHSPPATLLQGNCEFPEGEINIKMEDDNTVKNIVIISTPPELDFTKTGKENENYCLSTSELNSGYGSVIHHSSASFIRASNAETCSMNDAAHMNFIANKQPSTSKQCTASSRVDANTILLSALTSSEKRFSCEQCTAKFKTKRNLNRHYVVHSDEKAFTCDQCSAKFKRRKTLNQHLLRHSDKKAFSCNQCCGQFKRKHALNVHLLTHSNEKAFSCDLCPAQFHIKSNLNQHLLIHTNEKPFSCGYCCARFRRKHTLQDHISNACRKLPALQVRIQKKMKAFSILPS